MGLAAWFLLSIGVSPSWAGDPAAAGDGAISVALDGDVTCRCGSRKATPLAAYSKLRPGDEVELAAGSSVDLVFFASGRRERWAGPARVEVGTAGGVAPDAEPVVVELGGEVGTAMKHLPSILKRAEMGRSGGTLVRGSPTDVSALTPEEAAAVDGARTRYRTLREQAGESDIVPELYLATVLVDHGLHDESIGVLEEASRRCSECTAPKAILGWVKDG